MAKPCRIVVVDIVVDVDKCVRCGDCIDYCPMGVLRDRGDGVPSVAAREECIACIGCMSLCRPAAIRIVTDWVCRGAAGEEG